jgi:hypothetical protein
MIELGTRVSVIASYASNRLENISFRAGDNLVVGHRNQQFPVYVWCATEDGHHGWVPERFIERTADNEAVALCNYNAAHITVVKGEMLEVLDEAGGWLLCRNASGLQGWVPGECVKAA